MTENSEIKVILAMLLSVMFIGVVVILSHLPAATLEPHDVKVQRTVDAATPRCDIVWESFEHRVVVVGERSFEAVCMVKINGQWVPEDNVAIAPAKN